MSSPAFIFVPSNARSCLEVSLETILDLGADDPILSRAADRLFGAHGADSIDTSTCDDAGLALLELLARSCDDMATDFDGDPEAPAHSDDARDAARVCREAAAIARG